LETYRILDSIADLQAAQQHNLSQLQSKTIRLEAEIKQYRRTAYRRTAIAAIAIVLLLLLSFWLLTRPASIHLDLHQGIVQEYRNQTAALQGENYWLRRRSEAIAQGLARERPYFEHIVQPYENLYTLALTYYGDWRWYRPMAQYNRVLNPRAIQPGDTLRFFWRPTDYPTAPDQ
jgi:hypothetical protein